MGRRNDCPFSMEAEKVTLTAHCLEAAPGGQYDVRLSPQTLWLIEV